MGLGLRAGGHTAPGRPGFFLLGPWDRGLVRLQQRPTFPALRAAGNRFRASFSPLTQFTGSDGHSASLPGMGALKGPPPPRLLFFRFAMCYSFLGRETGLNSLGMVSKVSTCGSESLHRSLYKGKLKVLASYLLRLRTVSMLGFPFLSLPGNCSEVVEFVGD